jgi:serine/threonine protein kinase
MDSKNPKIPLVMKVSEDCKALNLEVHIMKKVEKNDLRLKEKDNFPDVIDYGLILKGNDNTKTILTYIIMPRYGYNLYYWFEKLRFKISKVTAIDIGLRLIRFFQKIHVAGYVYNDLKLDNILIGYGKKPPKVAEGSLLEGLSLHLVDFGFSSRYEKHGEHIA